MDFILQHNIVEKFLMKIILSIIYEKNEQTF